MMRSRAMTLLACAGLIVFARSDAAAQTPFLVLAQKDLAFGQLTPGVASAVAPTDLARRAEIVLQGQGSTSMVVTLPTHLVNTAGARIPLAFSATDGLLIIKHKTSRFDPSRPVSIKLNPSESEARVYFGGTAQPAAGQVAGSYTAAITVLVVPNGV